MHDAGDKVKAGHTVVAIIDPIAPEPLDARSRALAEARLDTATALLDKARTAHRFALSDLRRQQGLFAQGGVSEEELENFQWREMAAAKELAAAESAWREADAQLTEFTGSPTHHSSRSGIEVLAPASGRILRVLEENARVVPAGTPIMEIGDPTDLEVVIEALSRDGARLEPGAAVELHHWGDDEPLLAEVRLIEPAAFTKVSALGVEEQRVNVIADLLTPPGKRLALGDQFRVEARIVVWQATNVLKAPLGAFFRRGTDWAAFVIEHGRARLRAVRAGRAGALELQILEGLQEGEEVILYPGDRVENNTRVRPVAITPPASP
jgi:HlyD family secretion protein